MTTYYQSYFKYSCSISLLKVQKGQGGEGGKAAGRDAVTRRGESRGSPAPAVKPSPPVRNQPLKSLRHALKIE